MDDLELAYLAGFVDGEGSIAIGLSKNPKGERRWYLRFSVHQVNPEPLKILQGRFGGSLLYTKATATQRPIFEWATGSIAAGRALEQLRPYLIVKAAEADAALRFQSAMVPRGQRRLGLTEEQIAIRQAAYEELRALKQATYPAPEPKIKRVAKPKVKHVRVKVAEPVKSTGYDRDKKPDAGILRGIYLDHGLSVTAQEFGVSRQTVINWLNAYGIPRQGRTAASEARRKAAAAASWKVD